MKRLLIALALAGASGCAHFPENPPLARYDPGRGGYRFENLKATIANTDSLLVCLSFSGGGTRAAALAFGVMKKLRDTPIEHGEKRLLDEVDVISATSGGSFAAAYYGLHGETRFFSEFEERVLDRDLGMEVFWRGTLCPYNSIRLMSPWFDRSDLAAELYADTIFGDWPFAKLQTAGRPFIVLNATNLALGDRFEFTQDQFDLIGSNLAQVTVARAVAASSAFPFLLTPVTFKNHPCPPGFTLQPSVDAALADAEDDQGGYRRASERDRRGYFAAQNQKRLVAEKDRHAYIHLADGGIADNLGLGYVIDSYRRGSIHELLRTGAVKTLVVIVVNARNRPPDTMDASPRAPGALDVVTRSATTAIDNGAFELAEVLKDLRDERNRTRGNGAPGPAFHLIEVDLEDLADAAQRERLLAVETTFGLEPGVVKDVIAAGGELLDQSFEFRRLLDELR
jgi:predicted acylesterase/phospholipase RssA